MRVKYNHAKLVRETCDIKKKIYYSQVLRVMYELPKDIKIKIFQMVIKDHMEQWKKEHSLAYCIPMKHIRDIYADLHRQRLEYPADIPVFEELLERLRCHHSLKKKLLCNPTILNKKITIYEIKDIRYNEIVNRGLIGWSWAANKCRCFRCDLVRLAHRLDNVKSTILDPAVNKKYARITYNTGDKQWKTTTVSQMKTMRDKQRSQYRNEMKRAKKISLEL